jgi:DNA-binding protein H-NS
MGLSIVHRAFTKAFGRAYMDASVFKEMLMARPKSLANMSLEALVDLRDSIGATLSKRAADLQKQLSRLTGTDVGNGVKRGRPRKSSLKGRKVAAKYRSKKNRDLTWAGRGATPRWMKEEMKGGKLKKEAFLIK